jgi:pimeloyl-ACP methyl ester carboxylesterase
MVRNDAMGQREEGVKIEVDAATLEGDLMVPEHARGVVLFAHGSGSSRFSSRNRFVAQTLREVGMGTLLLDLLTPREEAVDRVTAQLRFDIGLLARRLVGAIDWLGEHASTRELQTGLFGASTGGGAALVAAAARRERVRAVVSRGGRPDLAGEALPNVQAPTLLIVGGADDVVIQLNQQAYERLPGMKRLEIVPGASHLFEEPGALEAVAGLARAWFSTYLPAHVYSVSAERGDT